MNADPKGMARALWSAVGDLRRAQASSHPVAAAHVAGMALANIEAVATTLENVIEPTPSYQEMLVWAMDTVEEATRVRERHVVTWLDEDGNPHVTYGTSWPDVIGKAMAEEKAMAEQAARTGVTT